MKLNALEFQLISHLYSKKLNNYSIPNRRTQESTKNAARLLLPLLISPPNNLDVERAGPRVSFICASPSYLSMSAYGGYSTFTRVFKLQSFYPVYEHHSLLYVSSTVSYIFVKLQAFTSENLCNQRIPSTDLMKNKRNNIIL